MPILELKGVSRRYKNGQITVEALKEIDLTVEEGEFLSIMGPSGSGKSTMLNLIGCLDRPSTGSLILSGQHVEKLSDNRLADIRNQFIGFVFQSFHLLPDLDAQANVELPLIYRGLGAKERSKRAVEALEAVGLGERRRHRPSQLSGGEQQRVAIARALVGDPALILADEPTGALDSRTGNTIMAIFQRLNRDKGLTIVQVTHERDIALHGSRVVHLKDGMIENIEQVPEPLVAREEETEIPVA